jgi:carbon-monoxide dehydrogenase small subunit
MTDDTRTITFTLNGRAVTARIAVYETLVEVLQREFALLGARESCAQGLCGCCTVLVDGTAVSGCLYLAAFADGADLVTVEGLPKDGVLHPVQQAFIDKGAFQCGFCTPGMLMTGTALLEEQPNPSRADVIHGLEGNLCRCTGYEPIIEAVLAAAKVGGTDPA